MHAVLDIQHDGGCSWKEGCELFGENDEIMKCGTYRLRQKVARKD